MVDAATATGRFLLAFVFLSAALPKLAARADFEEAVSNYDLLPQRLAAPVASWLPRVELGIAVVLFAGFALAAVGLLVAALLSIFSAAVAINLVRGREIDCGCSHDVAPRRIGWGLVATDIGLAGVAVLVALGSPGETAARDALAALVLAGSLFVGAQLILVWLPVLRVVRQLERSSVV